MSFIPSEESAIHADAFDTPSAMAGIFTESYSPLGEEFGPEDEMSFWAMGALALTNPKKAAKKRKAKKKKKKRKRRVRRAVAKGSCDHLKRGRLRARCERRLAAQASSPARPSLVDSWAAQASSSSLVPPGAAHSSIVPGAGAHQQGLYSPHVAQAPQLPGSVRKGFQSGRFRDRMQQFRERMAARRAELEAAEQQPVEDYSMEYADEAQAYGSYGALAMDSVALIHRAAARR